MAVGAMPVTIKERSAFLRVPGDHVANFVRKTIRYIRCARVQESGNVRDLLRSERRKGWHTSIWPPLPNNRADHVSFIVMRH
jgi:hypothetical protein